MILWAPVAAVLAKDHFVIVPDRRGMGLSSHPEGGRLEAEHRLERRNNNGKYKAQIAKSSH